MSKSANTRIVIQDELNPLPTNADELARCLADPEWRLFSGCLYKIMVKGDDSDDESVLTDSYVLPFNPNDAQRRFIKRLWHRNIILKARQLGFTTLIAVMWLDHALFNADQRCGIIAQDRETAAAIFRDKVKFAYDNLPEQIRERFPLKRDSAVELLFDHNNSSVRVATSVRGGTIHRLHVSEFGKICAKYPDKAAEVMTGSIPAVPNNGILVIESTAEGRVGDFFELTQTAQKYFFSRKKLSVKDYRLHFYAWWMEKRYRLNSRTVEVSIKDHEYFDEVEATVKQDMGIDLHLDADQRAWYIAVRDADFKGKEHRMWQEYPSFPNEAFQLSTDGNYYAKDMILIRQRNGITDVPELDIPVDTFWDIGNGDGCAIWFLQHSNGQDRWIRYFEAHDQTLKYYVEQLRSFGYVFGTHYLPHDADHKRLSDTNKSTREMLEDLMTGEVFDVVPRITELMNGIQQTRAAMKTYYFDAVNCKLGIERLEGYQKKWSASAMEYINQPNKYNGCSEAADAIRQHAQAKEGEMLDNRINRRRKGGYDPAPANDWRLM